MSILWISLIATVVVGLGTYLTRASFIVALADREFPERLKTALGFVAPAVMAALVVVLTVDDGPHQNLWVEFSALAVGGLVGWKTKSLIWVLVAGMATFWVLRAVVG